MAYFLALSTPGILYKPLPKTNQDIDVTMLDKRASKFFHKSIAQTSVAFKKYIIKSYQKTLLRLLCQSETRSTAIYVSQMLLNG